MGSRSPSFGTATTFDYVTAKGEYAGGLIVPGIAISLEALGARTAKLPRVELEEGPDERRLLLTEPRTCRAALQAISRVLKGWQEEAEAGGERDKRPQHLEVLRADRRDVDRVRDECSFERRRDLLGDDHAGPVLCLLGRGRQMRRDDDVVYLEQRARVRLGVEDIERGGGHLARPERHHESRFVEQFAAGRVH